MTSKKKDDLFSRSGTPDKFEFNAAVANVFDDMLKRSIPFYQECQTMVVALAVEFYRDDTFLYDLGCSTGTLLKQLAQTLPTNIQLVGLDNSRPMLDQAAGPLLEPGPQPAHSSRSEQEQKPAQDQVPDPHQPGAGQIGQGPLDQLALLQASGQRRHAQRGGLRIGRRALYQTALASGGVSGKMRERSSL